jgi:hypothetical protein
MVHVARAGEIRDLLIYIFFFSELLEGQNFSEELWVNGMITQKPILNKYGGSV